MEKKWWKEQVIYQIYPRSFNDTTGDGIGDIKGIINKLDYLHDLGVDIIWLCPIYQSPNDDNGYDISDYYSIHPEFGTMSDFDTLLKGVHSRGMKLIMDIVVNHTSDEHQWFVESKSSLENSYRDFYYWKEGKNGGPPNNWISFFGGSAWHKSGNTNEYYLHLFTKKQPDLNWENPKVRDEVVKILRFWLDKGIDGFRMDVIPLISKRLEFEDADISDFNTVIEKVYSNGPKVHEYINEIYERAINDYDVMTVGEGPGISTTVGLDYVGHDRRELNMIFHLDHMFLGHGPLGKFDPVPYGWKEIKDIIQRWYDAMGDSGWVSIFLDNHDFPRLVSRFGNDNKYRVQSAKLLAVMICTLRGTPCIYQGSEVGLTNVRFNTLDKYKDVETINFHKEFITRGVTEDDFLSRVHEHGRDNARTPIPWNDSVHGGFTQGEPWINVNPNYKDINVELDLNSEESIYKFYRKLLAYRKNNKTLIYGTYKVVMHHKDQIYAYERKDNDGEYYIVHNHNDIAVEFNVSSDDMKLEIGNYDSPSSTTLKPWESRVYKKV